MNLIRVGIFTAIFVAFLMYLITGCATTNNSQWENEQQVSESICLEHDGVEIVTYMVGVYTPHRVIICNDQSRFLWHQKDTTDAPPAAPTVAP